MKEGEGWNTAPLRGLLSSSSEDDDIYFSIDLAMSSDEVYYLSVSLSVLAALLLFISEEVSSGGCVTTIAVLYPIISPEEVIPFVSGDSFPENRRSIGFGLVCPKRVESPSRAPDQPATTRAINTDLASSLKLTTKAHSYFAYFVTFIRGMYHEAIATAMKTTQRKTWNTVWWKEFYLQHVFKAGEDVCNRPVVGPVGGRVTVCTRDRHRCFDCLTDCTEPDCLKLSCRHPSSSLPWLKRPLSLNGGTINCLNLASYNYLGFGGVCEQACIQAIEKFGTSPGIPRAQGTHQLVEELEREIAKFVGKSDSLVMAMGYATNAALIPAMLRKGEIVNGQTPSVFAISDELNHRSIIEGVRLSGAKTAVFRHNDMADLERVLLKEIGTGTEKSLGIFSEIWFFVEGIYSMEGEFCLLPDILALKRKYSKLPIKIWLDEAHSIGAVGPTGRGVAEKFGVIGSGEVDVMMGTFTKSFASAGGYVAAEKPLIDRLRSSAFGYLEANAMPPVCAAQVLAVLQKPDRVQRVQKVSENANYFRTRLGEIGCKVIGDDDSPVVCILMVQPQKAIEFSRACLAQGLAVVVTGYPVTPLLLARARFCVSADHSIEDLEFAVSVVDGLRDVVGFGYGEKVVQNKRLNYSTQKNSSFHCANKPKTDSYSTPPPEPNQLPFSNDPLLVRSSALFRVPVLQHLRAVGLGTCGPRGFYGTTLEHMKLEKSIAKFLKFEACTYYATHASVSPSVVSAFVGKEDLVFAQDSVSTGIRLGLEINRVKRVTYWNATSKLDLPSLLAISQEFRIKNPRSKIWFICEGGSKGLDLRTIITLKDALQAHIILDDSNCFGASGTTGRGSIEVAEVFPSSIDILIGSLENAAGTVGGFCCGDRTVKAHQELFSGGYCFSASPPSIFAVAGLEFLKWLDLDEGRMRLVDLQKKIAEFRTGVARQFSKNDIELLNSGDCYVQDVKFSVGLIGDSTGLPITRLSSNVLRIRLSSETNVVDLLNNLKACSKQ